MHRLKTASLGRCVVLLAAMLVLAPIRLAAVHFRPAAERAVLAGKTVADRQFLNDQVAQGEIPGAIVLIQRHGKPVYFKIFGKRESTPESPMTPDTIFPLHSMTKTITSVAAMMLVDHGKIARRSRQQIHSVLCRHEGRRRKKDKAGKTGAHLVPPRRPSPSRTCCCIPPASPMAFMANWSKAACDGIYLGDFTMPIRRADREVAAGRTAAHAVGLRTFHRCARPRHRGRLGAVAVSVREEPVFDPLGMTTTKFFLTDPGERARYAQPLRKDRDDERNSLDVTRWESGGGGLVTTIADFARYGQMLLNGGELDGKTYLSPHDFRGDDDGPYRPGLRRRAQLFRLPGRRLWFRLRFRHPHRSWQCGAAAAGFARRDQKGRRDRRLSRGRSAPRTCFSSSCKTRRRRAST